MDFQSFQSKRAIEARKEMPRNYAMTGYSGVCTDGTRNTTLKRRQFQSRDLRAVCVKNSSGASDGRLSVFLGSAPLSLSE